MAIVVFGVGLAGFMSGEVVLGSLAVAVAMLAVVVSIRVRGVAAIDVELMRLIRVHLRFDDDQPRAS
jgi:hypothetical protein